MRADLVVSRAEEAGGLPRFVEQEFEEYLRCGLLEWGCLHLVCRSCGHSELVALSCKRGWYCPACLGRRMSDTSVHLSQRVLPQVPIRHWIASLPWGLRALLGYWLSIGTYLRLDHLSSGFEVGQPFGRVWVRALIGIGL